MLEARDMRRIAELADELIKIEAVQNQVYATEFNTYQALFIASTITNMTQKDIIELSTKFARRFNLYKPIEVYDDTDGHLMFKVPQLFVPIKDVDHQFVNAVDKFRSEGVSEIPKYSSEATQGLLTAIMKSQLDVTDEGCTSYSEYISKLTGEYANDLKLFDTLQERVKVTSEKEPAEKSEDVSNFDGLSWE